VSVSMNILETRFIQLLQHNNMIVNLRLELMYDLHIRHACAYKHPPHSTTYLRPTLKTRIEHSPLIANAPIKKNKYVTMLTIVLLFLFKDTIVYI
jgi:hypothetical protein